MEKKVIISDSKELIKDLELLISSMSKTPEEIPQIEIDLVKGKLRKIYDLLLQMEQKDETISEASIQEKSLPQDDEIEELKTTKIVSVQIQQMDDEIMETKPEEVVQNEIPPPLQEDGSLDLFAEPSVISDVEMQKTVVEKISEGKSEETVADKMQKNKITGLKSSIGINEKFYFINELFEGNMNDYNDAIDKLEECDSLELANDVLSALAHEKEWPAKSESFIQLKGFIERKFK